MLHCEEYRAELGEEQDRASMDESQLSTTGTELGDATSYELDEVLSRSMKVHRSRQFRVLGRKSSGGTKPNGPQGGQWVC